MSSFAALYRQLVLDHARDPYGAGLTDDDTARVHEHNPVCGDEIELAARVADDRVVAVRWEGHGCAISQASASMLAVLVEDRPVDDARALVEEFREAMRSRGELELDEDRFGDAAALSGTSRYVARVKCAMLAWVAFERSLARA